MAEKKKKKEKTEISLPNISRSIKRSREMAQGKANYADGMKAIGIVLGILVVLFILLGGINQRKFVETMIDWAGNVGGWFASWVDKGDLDVNEDGVYLKPAGPDGGLISGHGGTLSNDTDKEPNNTDENSKNTEATTSNKLT